MKSILAKIKTLELRLASNDFQKYKELHPNTKKTPSDPMFSGEYQFNHKTEPGTHGDSHYITVHHKPTGKQVGSVGFKTNSLGELQVDSSNDEHEPNVEKKHRRKGLGTSMYTHAEDISGKKIIPTGWLSGDGSKLWKQKNRPFG